MNRLRRLKNNGYRPDRCLFTTRLPRQGDPLKEKAFAEIRQGLLDAEIEIVTEDEADKIIKFASFPEAANLKLAQ